MNTRKVHIHDDQFDGHPHPWCGRGSTAVTVEEFEATPLELRCAVCDTNWFPTGQPEWHYLQAIKNRKPRVFNKREVGEVPGAVYVGRPSEFGNPYMNGHHGTREQVIARFEKYLRADPELMESVRRELRGKDLLCWCSPKPCHADVLLKVANE